MSSKEEIYTETAEKLAEYQPTMVADLADMPNSARTVLVDSARIDGAEGIVHIVVTGRKNLRYFAKFTSDAEYRKRWGR